MFSISFTNRGQFYKPLYAKQKVANAQLFDKKFAIQFHQRSALMKFAQYVGWNSPNKFAICQMAFAKKKLLVMFEKKSQKNGWCNWP